MKVLVPGTITLSSSTVSEPDTNAGDPAEWSSGTSYSDLDRCTVSQAEDGSAVNTYTNGVHRIYRNDSGGNSTDEYPPDNPTIWTDLGATNRWKMFDEYSNTKTEESGADLEVTVDFSGFDAFSVTDCSGNGWGFSTTAAGGSFFYGEETTFSLLKYISSGGNSLNFGIDSDNGAYDPYCSVLVIGTLYDLGETQFPVDLGLIDKSQKAEDSDGNVSLSQGNYRKTASVDVWVDHADLDDTYDFLIDNRGTALVFQLDNIDPNVFPNKGAAMLMYGFIRNFSLIWSNPQKVLLNIDIESLT